MNVKNSDIASKPITTSLTSKAVHEKYFNDLWGELEEYWKVLNSIQGMKIDELFQGFSTSKPIYWFGDITFHCEDFSRRVLKHELKKFPASISRAKEFEKASGEFCYLFPQSELTAQFLPLLLTCYFLRRNVQEEFVKHLRYHSNYISLSDIRRKIKKFQAIPRLEDEYKSLFAGKTSRIISLENLSRVQAIYRKIIVFFFFLNATTVNVALSFFAFEAMTGYIGIRFGRNFNKEYYEHCKTVTSVSQCGVSIKGIVLTYVVILAVSVLVSIIAGAVALNSINSLIEDSYTDLSIGDSTYDDYDTIPEPSYSDPTAPAEDYSEGVVMMSNSYRCDFDSSYAVITIEYHEEITDPDNQYVTADYILSDTDEVIIHLEGFATTVDDYEIMLEDETGLCLDIVKPNFDELFVTTSGENMPGITFEGQYYAF